MKKGGSNNWISNKIIFERKNKQSGASGAIPVVIHIINLPLDVTVDALAIGAVCQLSDHAQPIRPLLAGEKLLDGNDDALPAPLSVHTHNLLTQWHLWRTWSSLFGFTPPSLQRSGRKGWNMRRLFKQRIKKKKLFFNKKTQDAPW